MTTNNSIRKNIISWLQEGINKSLEILDSAGVLTVDEQIEIATKRITNNILEIEELSNKLNALKNMTIAYSKTS